MLDLLSLKFGLSEDFHQLSWPIIGSIELVGLAFHVLDRWLGRLPQKIAMSIVIELINLERWLLKTVG